MKKILLISISVIIAAAVAGLAFSGMRAEKDKSCVKLQVNGMVCAACVVSVQKSLKKVPGVEKVRISAIRSEAVITLKDSSVSRATLITAVKAAGFEAREGPRSLPGDIPVKN